MFLTSFRVPGNNCIWHRDNYHVRIFPSSYSCKTPTSSLLRLPQEIQNMTIILCSKIVPPMWIDIFQWKVFALVFRHGKWMGVRGWYTQLLFPLFICLMAITKYLRNSIFPPLLFSFCDKWKCISVYNPCQRTSENTTGNCSHQLATLEIFNIG